MNRPAMAAQSWAILRQTAGVVECRGITTSPMTAVPSHMLGGQSSWQIAAVPGWILKSIVMIGSARSLQVVQRCAVGPAVRCMVGPTAEGQEGAFFLLEHFRAESAPGALGSLAGRISADF